MTNDEIPNDERSPNDGRPQHRVRISATPGMPRDAATSFGVPIFVILSSLGISSFVIFREGRFRDRHGLDIDIIPRNAMSLVRADIAALQGYVPGEQPQTGKFIKLNTNENPYPPSPKVLQAIVETASHSLPQYPDPLASAFRIRAAEVLQVEPDWILCGNGSDDILTIVTRALVDQGKTIRLPYPSYVLYKTLARIQGAAYQEVHFHPDWTLSDDFFVNTPDLKVAYLPNPNSPSGTVVSKDEILRLANQLPCPLLVDEAYADFADENCVELVAESDRILVTRSMSKSYSLAGLRFGFIIAQPSIIQQLMKVKDSYNCDALSIAGATAAIDDQDWLRDNRKKILATRQRLAEQLEKMGFSVQPSQANFLWCTHSGQPVQPIYEKLKQQRVLIRYMDYPGWGDGLRVTVGTDEQMDAFLSILQTIV